MSQLKYWVWLSALDTINARSRAALYLHFGTAEDIYYADEGEFARVEGLSLRDKSELKNKSLDRAEAIMETCEIENIRIVTIQDAEYPDRLKNIDAPPLTLYIKGNFPRFDEEAAVAVVGSRKHTAYGGLVAERISYELALAGALVVSGMAKGIDACANRGALRAGRPTVAVLGCGPDVIYPTENRELYSEIASRGCILSEYTPGTRPFGGNFPVRNRIISGLSLGVLVVEAPSTSGALITANCALEQGRDVFAVPGNIDVEINAGANELIKEGAKLVTSAEDILIEYIRLFPHKLTPVPPPQPYGKTFGRGEAEMLKVAQKPVPYETGRRAFAARLAPEFDEKPREKITEDMIKGFTELERKIIVSIMKGPLHADEIVARCGGAAADCLSALTILELEGAVLQQGGKYFSLSEEYFKGKEA